MSLEKLHVAVIQCNSSENWEINFTQIEALISQLPDPTDLIVLPESAFYRGHQRREYSINLRDKHPLLEKLRSLTKKRKGWILAGTVLEEHPSRRYFQTSILLNRKGEIVALYRKTHLFRVTLEDGTIIDEQLFYSPGNEYILVEIDGWHAGLSICYDLRFPEIFRSYRKAGAEIFLLVANFTQGNSPDHWITLNRARAIENQCFMVSANQVGKNPQQEGFPACGQSLIIGPWGEILAEASSQQEGICFATLSKKEIQRIRRRIPHLPRHFEKHLELKRFSF